jgi:hypothetical protein
VGDEITMHVTRVTDYQGNEEINLHDAVVVESSGNRVDGYRQDLSSGREPEESLEAELVMVLDAEVASLSGLDATLDYGTASGVTLRTSDSSGLCVGAVVDVIAVVTEWAATGVHRIQSFDSSDFVSIDTTGCDGDVAMPEPGELVINEFLADPPNDAAGDANCDGIRDGTDDEFVEIVSVSSMALDLGGVTVNDSTPTINFTFPSGTTLDPGGAVVVFGGGTPMCAFGADVLVFDSGGLGLNNEGDTIIVADRGGTVISTATYTGTSSDDASQTLSPDLDDTDASTAGVAGFVLHDSVGARLFFSGTRIDGTSF